MPMISEATGLVHQSLRADWAAPRRLFSLTIKAIVLDLDGTIMPTYRMLIAAQFMDAHLARQSPRDPGFIRHFLVRHGFQSLLHRAALARGTALEYARERGLEVAPSALQFMSRLQEESYCLYDGVRELIDQARDNGAFVGIYTNTPFDCALHRLIRARFDLRSIDALWATTPADRRSASCGDHADLIIPCHSGKPDDTPLRDLQTHASIGPDEILFVGESLCDLEAVHRDKTNPAAIFCFQEQGARDICARTTGINARLRPRHASLGADAVNSRVEGYGIGGDIIRLRNGFGDLLQMIDEGRICLDAPARTPVVRQNRLAAGRMDIRQRAGQTGRFARPVVASFPQFAAAA